jgi:hypothetical protein
MRSQVRPAHGTHEWEGRAGEEWKEGRGRGSAELGSWRGLSNGRERERGARASEERRSGGGRGGTAGCAKCGQARRGRWRPAPLWTAVTNVSRVRGRGRRQAPYNGSGNRPCSFRRPTARALAPINPAIPAVVGSRRHLPPIRLRFPSPFFPLGPSQRSTASIHAPQNSSLRWRWTQHRTLTLLPAPGPQSRARLPPAAGTGARPRRCPRRPQRPHPR